MRSEVFLTAFSEVHIENMRMRYPSCEGIWLVYGCAGR